MRYGQSSLYRISVPSSLYGIVFLVPIIPFREVRLYYVLAWSKTRTDLSLTDAHKLDFSRNSQPISKIRNTPAYPHQAGRNTAGRFETG